MGASGRWDGIFADRQHPGSSPSKAWESPQPPAVWNFKDERRPSLPGTFCPHLFSTCESKSGRCDRYPSSARLPGKQEPAPRAVMGPSGSALSPPLRGAKSGSWARTHKGTVVPFIPRLSAHGAVPCYPLDRHDSESMVLCVSFPSLWVLVIKIPVDVAYPLISTLCPFFSG